MLTAGVDGCRGGWCAVVNESGTYDFRVGVYPTLLDLIDHVEPDIVAIDIPIGLTDEAFRQADKEARKELGTRACCVFPAPLRSALHAPSWEDACAISQKLSGKKVTRQSFGIFRKVAEVDSLLKNRPGLRSRVFEVHPEVSFALWDNAPIQFGKKTSRGKLIRHLLVEQGFGIEAANIDPPPGARLDDLHDAWAALWTGHRISHGVAISLPAAKVFDSTGIRMAIWV